MTQSENKQTKQKAYYSGAGVTDMVPTGTRAFRKAHMRRPQACSKHGSKQLILEQLFPSFFKSLLIIIVSNR
jgi:hypothetical protein